MFSGAITNIVKGVQLQMVLQESGLSLKHCLCVLYVAFAASSFHHPSVSTLARCEGGSAQTLGSGKNVENWIYSLSGQNTASFINQPSTSRNPPQLFVAGDSASPRSECFAVLVEAVLRERPTIGPMQKDHAWTTLPKAGSGATSPPTSAYYRIPSSHLVRVSNYGLASSTLLQQ